MTSLVVWLLKTFGSRKVLEEIVFASLETPPMRGIISQDASRRLTVSGRVLSPEQILGLRESAQNALDSQALKVVRDQVRFKAIDEGYLSAADPTKTSTFYKAALWYAQEERAILEGLAGQNPG